MQILIESGKKPTNDVEVGHEGKKEGKGCGETETIQKQGSPDQKIRASRKTRNDSFRNKKKENACEGLGS